MQDAVGGGHFSICSQMMLLIRSRPAPWGAGRDEKLFDGYTSAIEAHMRSNGALKLWRPSVDDAKAEEALAQCLSSAFSSGIWREAPMPLGPHDDPASALGVIQSLGPRPLAVAASFEHDSRVIGCVIGCIMDDDVIDRYSLADYGAEHGDGLLAFIGIVPEAQGFRFDGSDGETLNSAPRGPSLARHLFQTWIGSEAIDGCARLFIRTRRRIGPIRYLSEDFGFDFRGGFQTEFRGQVQTRLVYCRTNERQGGR